MPYGITQCYLPPAFTPADDDTRFSDPGGMQGRVDLCYVKADRLGIEPATCKSQVQRPTAEPPRNIIIFDMNVKFVLSQFAIVRPLLVAVFTRASLCYRAICCHLVSVYPSVCHKPVWYPNRSNRISGKTPHDNRATPVL